MRVTSKEIMVRFCEGYRKYPFAMGTLYNSAGVIIGEGMIPAGDAIYNAPKRDEQLDDVILGVIFDPEFMNRDTMATGIKWY